VPISPAQSPAPPVDGPRRAGGPRRRVVLLAGLGLAASAITGGALVADGVLPGRTRLWQALGLNGPDGVVPDVTPGPIVSGAFTSAARGGVRTGWTIAYPPGPRTGTTSPLPVCVLLHGHGDDERALQGIGFDRFLADAVRRGATPFALAAVAGGDGYWHARRGGGDAGRMVVEEFLPLLAARGLAAGPADRVALLGWSMGGYGALLLAERLGAGRVAALGAMSPALFRSFADTVPGAFDDAADLAANDVYAGRPRLTGIPLRVDCGRGDPFLPAVEAFVGGLRPAPEGGFPAGGHTVGFWRRVIPAQLDLIGPTLTPRRRP
jgi:predicted esterase